VEDGKLEACVLDYARRTGGQKRAAAGDLLFFCAVASLLIVVVSTAWLASGSRFDGPSKLARCRQNLATIAACLEQHAKTQGGRYPDGLEDLFVVEGLPANCCICPLTEDRAAKGRTPSDQAAAFSKGGHCSYVYLGRGLKTTAPAGTVLLYEPLNNHKNGSTWVLYADGTGAHVSEPEASRLISELELGHNPPRPERRK
jgi:hypothetical protein